MKFVLPVLILITISSCKKDYTCSCSNPGGVYYSEEILNSSKKDAEKECSKHVPDIVFSESDCKLSK